MEWIEISAGSPAERLAQLDDLLAEVFGLTFASWHSRGGWTGDYTCYALSEQGKILSNVGVYGLDLLVNGRPKRALQLGAVATRRDRRGQGLSGQVLHHVLDRFPGQPFFLCANETVLDYYPRFGFRRVESWEPLAPGAPGGGGPALPGLRRLAVNDHSVVRYLAQRACFSQVLDCTNAAPLNLFHLLYTHPDNIYEIPDLGVLLIAEQQGSTLRLVDVAAGRPVTWAGLAPYLKAAFAGVAQVSFGFNPDWLGVGYDLQSSDLPLYFRGDMEVQERFKLPELLMT